MFRAIFDLLVIIIIAIVARAVLTTLFKGISTASSNAFQQRSSPMNPESPRTGDPAQAASTGSPAQAPFAGSDLHKDPVCGTYVAESTSFRRQVGGQSFYYCSEGCRAKHAQRV